MESLQSDFIGFRERFVQLFRRISLGILERLAGKLKTTEEPHQSLCRLPLLLALLILYQVF